MKILLSLIFVFSTASVFGDWPPIHDDFANVRPSWSGSWYNPEQPGHGISVEILDEERTIIFWYTYDLDGKPFWLVAQGVNSEVRMTGMLIPFIRVEATVYYHEGMVYGEFDPATKNQQEWGTIVLDFPYWDCNRAHMAWYPVMEGFWQGATDLVRLTTLYGLDCVDWSDTAGNWEVQFGFDAEHKYQAEIVATPNPDFLEGPILSFEFFDETDCLWSGRVSRGLILSADWKNQCGMTAVEHEGDGIHYYEYELCYAENECVWKDEVMIFEDDGEYLIFSR